MSSNLRTEPDAVAEEQPIFDLLRAQSAAEARKSAEPLLQTQVAARLAKRPNLTEALNLWGERVADSSFGERLQALALLWRVTSLTAMSGHRKRLLDRLSGGLAAGFAPLNSLDDPKDRKAVADAFLALPLVYWIPQYVGQAIVSDPDPKSDARDSLAAVLVRQTRDLSEAFEIIGAQFADLTFQQKDPSAGRARRLAWILRSMRTAILADESATPGDDLGESYVKVVRIALGSTITGDRTAASDSGKEVLVTLNQIVRLHGLRVATSANTYAAVEFIRKRYESTEWPMELQEAVDKLSLRVSDALFVLARQGIADASLRRVYLTLLGKVMAEARLSRMVSESAGLDSEIAFWLQTGRTRERLESASAVEETATALVDTEIAQALREAFFADQALESGKDPDVPLRRMARSLREAARKRGIVLRGRPGEVVDLSPNEHEIDSEVLGSRRVVLETPIVERVVGGRSVSVLLKAQVKPEGEA